jgi:hypothetical protein
MLVIRTYINFAKTVFRTGGYHKRKNVIKTGTIPIKKYSLLLPSLDFVLSDN